jgi:phage gpG-like protein
MTPAECVEMLSGAALRAGSLAPILEDFAEHRMKPSIKENFIAGGRPEAWIPSKDHPGHRATLVDHGDLVDSTTAFAENGTDVVLAAGGGGQPPAKAPALQYGADIHRKNVKRLRGQFLAKSSRKRKDVTRGESFDVHLPARPYLLFQDEDLDYLRGTMLAFIFGDEAP